MAAKERRAHPRYRLWIPARIQGEAEISRLAVGHDMSQKGTMLVTRAKLEAGAAVRLFVRIPPDSKQEHEIGAKVVRTALNDADPDGLWPFRLALEFDEPYPEIESLLREHSALLEGMGDASEDEHR